jgi:hypothetical protein
MITKVHPAVWLDAQAYERKTWEDNASLAGNDWNDWWFEQFRQYEFLRDLGGVLVEHGCGPYTNARLIEPVMKPTVIELWDPLLKAYTDMQCWVAENAKRCSCNYGRLESWLPRHKNSAVVCINVLDHVQSAEACMKALVGGADEWLVLGQDLTYEDDLPGDVGHPMRLELDWLRSFLVGFDAHMDLVVPSRGETHHKRGCLLWAGRKRR